MAKTTVNVPVKFRTPSFNVVPNGYVPASAPSAPRSWSVMSLVFGIIGSAAAIALVVLVALLLAMSPSKELQQKQIAAVEKSATDISDTMTGSTNVIGRKLDSVGADVRKMGVDNIAQHTATRAVGNMALAELKKIGRSVRTTNRYLEDIDTNLGHQLDYSRQIVEASKRGTEVTVDILRKSGGTGFVH